MMRLPPWALQVLIGWSLVLVLLVLGIRWYRHGWRQAMVVAALVTASQAVVIGVMAVFGLPSLWVVLVIVYAGIGLTAWVTWPQWGPIFGFRPRRRVGPASEPE